jgi:hypothetical protein
MKVRFNLAIYNRLRSGDEIAAELQASTSERRKWIAVFKTKDKPFGAKHLDFIYIAFLLSLVLFQSCTSERWKEKVLDACVNDYQRHSYFISLKVKTDSAVVRCLVRTGYLFLYFRHQQGLDEKGYATLAKSIIKKDSLLEVNAEDRKRYGFTIIYGCDEITQELKKGTACILETYFYKKDDWYLFKGAVTNETKNGIIDALFKQHVIVTTGDESGDLMVPGWQFRK